MSDLGSVHASNMLDVVEEESLDSSKGQKKRRTWCRFVSWSL